MSGCFVTLIQQSTDDYAPPGEPLLEVTVIGNDVCLTIVDYVEDSATRQITERDAVVVPFVDLLHALIGGAASAPRGQRVPAGEGKPAT